jgi:hypothetical protein
MANEWLNGCAPQRGPLCAAGDGEIGGGSRHGKRWLSRRPARVAAAALSVLGVAIAGVECGGWGFERHSRAEPAPSVVKPTPSPDNVRPPIPPDEMLNGQYRLTLEDSKSTYIDSSASQWSAGSVDHVGYIKFSTQCTGDECTATSIPTGDPDSGQTVETLVWVSGEWSSREKPITDGDGLDESTTVLHFDGRNGFQGTTTDTIISGPHTGAELIAPVVLTPRFDPANL